MREDPKYLEKKINYYFKNKNYIHQAITHRSHSEFHNERLEFLGDALLGVIIAELLYTKFQDCSEGVLTRLRASLVKKESLAMLAGELEIKKFILLGEGELRSGGLQRRSILADCLEAIIAAIYLDSDFDTCKSIVSNWYKDRINQLDTSTADKDAKTILQELLQAKQISLPIYTIIDQYGAAHDQMFEVSCCIDALSILTTAKAKNRRTAEQEAAAHAIEIMKKNKKQNDKK